MSRIFSLGLLLLVVAGCRLPSERLPVVGLPEDSPPLPYPELLTRARLIASAANESFFVDRWLELEENAKTLEQTARFLARATEVPSKFKDTLVAQADDLAKECIKLREVAKAKDVKQANEVLQRINLKIRELRLD